MIHDIETVNYCYRMLRDMIGVVPGEEVAVTYDTESCEPLALATAQAAHMLGAKPLLMKTVITHAPGREGDDDLPMPMMIGALTKCDAWIEYNENNLYSSTVYNTVNAENKKCRYILLMGMNTGGMKRLIGSVNMPVLADLTHRIQDVTQKTKHTRILSTAGTDIEFDHVPDHPVTAADGIVKKGEFKMVPGQISWLPKWDTINGVIVAEVSMFPLAKISDPFKLTVEKGYITRIEGGGDARVVEAYFKNFNDPNMYRLAHISYGFNPGAKPGNGIVENERLWGAAVFGFGNVAPSFIRGTQLERERPEGYHADGHTDAICPQATFILDGQYVFKEGDLVGPTDEIVQLGKNILY